ncbi:MAG: transposase [Pirellulales bacterium]
MRCCTLTAIGIAWAIFVMPNHVHLLAAFSDSAWMRRQVASWLHYTAAQIHRRLGLSGHFWQQEPFDHLVRSPEQYDYLRNYIAANPARARLQPGEFLTEIRSIVVDRSAVQRRKTKTFPTRARWHSRGGALDRGAVHDYRSTTMGDERGGSRRTKLTNGAEKSRDSTRTTSPV